MFISALQAESPPLACIDQVQVSAVEPNGFKGFEIVHSESIEDVFQPISPDVSICDDCLNELFDSSDRRYRYPFINCTNCGPRFTIITDIPYDRPLTTMASFEMCPQCEVEYLDPTNRRFHAQPIACPDCGPKIWLDIGNQQPAASSRLSAQDDPISDARKLLTEGKILAVKGLGGFHLACDATNPAAVSELRSRKLRVDKPFALMFSDLTGISAHCHLNGSAVKLLESRERPIVILSQISGSNIAEEVAPGQNRLGVMLPYTPLHYLLLEQSAGFPQALVMTSGNLNEEPIATSNEEAQERLSSLADGFLMHDREIGIRCDDSVIYVLSAANQSDRPTTSTNEIGVYPLRRSRGYAPYPLKLPWEAPPILATGAELKNTFCLAKGHYAFMSHHIGDMGNYETLMAFENGVDHYERLFRVQPEALAYDLHPDYLATRYAHQRATDEQLPAIGVQHHHAHIASVMADNNLSGDRPVIGVSFDGTGFGDDGAIWGGEFLLADYAGYQRPYHLVHIPLPGGDRAVREPWRMALAWLSHSAVEWSEDLAPVKFATHNAEIPSQALNILAHQIQSGINSPPTSSMGRLFDAVSALVGLRQTINYEGQAAIELETLAYLAEDKTYPFDLLGEQIDAGPLIRTIVRDLRAGVQVPTIASRFHHSLARMVTDVCLRLQKEYKMNDVVLSGGVWQNVTLLKQTLGQLRKHEFEVYLHQQVPANDGGLALGQAAVAASRLIHSH
jgi:hydrogenase maturation protein HypF